MSSAFVELLRKSNLDYIITRKSLKLMSQKDELIFATLIETTTKTLKFIACLDKPESVAMWSTSLDEREFQLNARLLDLEELGQIMNFLAERLHESDFTATKAISAHSSSQSDASQINVAFSHPKTKQSITLHLCENTDNAEKASLLSKILLHIYKRSESLAVEVKTQQTRIKELTTRPEHAQSRASIGHSIFDGTKSANSSDPKVAAMKSQGHTGMSLINPTAKRRKVATGVDYDEDDSD